MVANYVTGSVTLSDMIPIETRATYQSINNLAWGTGAVLGAALGGFLADSIGWRYEISQQT